MTLTPLRALLEREKAVAALTTFHEVAVRRGYPRVERPGIPRDLGELQRIQGGATVWEFLHVWASVHDQISAINPRSFDHFMFVSDAPTPESHMEARLEFENAYREVITYF